MTQRDDFKISQRDWEERFNRLFIDREFRIKELRDTVARLEKKVAKL